MCHFNFCNAPPGTMLLLAAMLLLATTAAAPATGDLLAYSGAAAPRAMRPPVPCATLKTNLTCWTDSHTQCMWDAATAVCSDCTDAGRVEEAARECHNKLVAGYGSHMINCAGAAEDWVMLLGCSAVQTNCNMTAPRSHSGVNWRCYNPKSLDANLSRYVGKSGSDYCMPRVDSCAPPPPPPPTPPVVPCKPNATPPERCPGGKTCPDCGKATCSCPKVRPAAIAAAAPATGAPLPRVAMTQYLVELSDWIMTLDVGSNVLKGDFTPASTMKDIFINGNLARVLLTTAKITGNATYLAEGLRWCDTFAGLQYQIETSKGESGGYWDTGYMTIYIADTGTAVTNLILGWHMSSDEEQKAVYVKALGRYARFVTGGCTTVPKLNSTSKPLGTKCPPKGTGWVNTKGKDAGSLGDGYCE